MKNKIKFTTLLFASALLLMTSGCGAPETGNYQEDTDRFATVIKEGYSAVFVDTETGVMYFYHKDGYSGGMSVMLNENGDPLIWEEEN